MGVDYSAYAVIGVRIPRATAMLELLTV